MLYQINPTRHLPLRRQHEDADDAVLAWATQACGDNYAARGGVGSRQWRGQGPGPKGVVTGWRGCGVEVRGDAGRAQGAAV